MQRYTLPGPASLTRNDHAGRVEAWLRSQGLTTAGVSIRWEDTGYVTVTVNADADPTDALAAYQPTLTDDEQERAQVITDAQAAIAEIKAKNRNARSATEKALLGLAAATDAPVFTPSTPEEPIPDVEPVAPAEVDA